ncbi:MAG: rRNA maturation RNase YbeY, partial [Vulcanimicrobiaceae bacterium]
MRTTAQRLLEAAGRSDSVLSITLVGDAAIRKLNREYRRQDRATDVLSFRLGDDAQSHLLGDVVISVATAKRQA